MLLILQKEPQTFPLGLTTYLGCQRILDVVNLKVCRDLKASICRNQEAPFCKFGLVISSWFGDPISSYCFQGQLGPAWVVLLGNEWLNPSLRPQLDPCLSPSACTSGHWSSHHRWHGDPGFYNQRTPLPPPPHWLCKTLCVHSMCHYHGNTDSLPALSHSSFTGAPVLLPSYYFVFLSQWKRAHICRCEVLGLWLG